MIVADPEWFTAKDKLIIYTKAFVKLYKQRNCGQVQEIYRMVELKKKYAPMIKNPYNFNTHYIIEVFSVFCNAHIVFKDQNRAVFDINNYID